MKKKVVWEREMLITIIDLIKAGHYNAALLALRNYTRNSLKQEAQNDSTKNTE